MKYIVNMVYLIYFFLMVQIKCGIYNMFEKNWSQYLNLKRRLFIGKQIALKTWTGLKGQESTCLAGRLCE